MPHVLLGGGWVPDPNHSLSHIYPQAVTGSAALVDINSPHRPRSRFVLVSESIRAGDKSRGGQARPDSGHPLRGLQPDLTSSLRVATIERLSDGRPSGGPGPRPRAAAGAAQNDLVDVGCEKPRSRAWHSERHPLGKSGKNSTRGESPCESLPAASVQAIGS
jgi:hypothetical protein